MQQQKGRPADNPGADDNLLRRIVDRLLETNRDSRNTVFIGGTGRSGTSWLAEVLNYDNHYRYIFEPFQARYVPITRPFYYGLYLRPADGNPAYLEPATHVMAGNVRHRWCDRHNKRLLAHQRLIKEVRGNLWLKWLRNQFPGIPMIFIMRHPFAVAASRRWLDWPPRSRAFFMQESLQSDFPGAFWDEFKQADTLFERYIFDWCVQHYIPLQQFAPGDFHYVFYEDLCVQPEAVAHGMFAHVGRGFDDRLFRKLSEPSATSRDSSPIRAGRTGKELITAWRTLLTPAEIERGSEILAKFGLHHIYDDGCVPHADGIKRFTMTMRTTSNSAPSHAGAIHV